MAAMGVHLGHTSVCVAVFRDGQAAVVADEAGDRVTPAAVAFGDDGGVAAVGEAALRQGQRNNTTVVLRIKQVLGRGSEDAKTQRHMAESQCPLLVSEGGGAPRYAVGPTRHVSPEDVAAVLFRKMKETARLAVGGSDVTDAVLAVPVDFSAAQRSAVRTVAAAAGLRVLRLVHEPTAALLAHCRHLVGGGEGTARQPVQSDSSGRSVVLVYKLGGTSLSVTAVRVSGEGMVQVLATHTDGGVGGESFTRALSTHLSREFARSHEEKTKKKQEQGACTATAPRVAAKLLAAAEEAKRTLSSQAWARCAVDSLFGDGVALQCDVSRARFEQLCAPLFQRCGTPVGEVLRRAGRLSARDVGEVVLCGGAARMPRLRTTIQELLPSTPLSSSSTPPDEAVALGAALQAGLLLEGGANAAFSLEEEEGEGSVGVATSASDILLKEEAEGAFRVLLPAGTPLPARRHHTLRVPPRGGMPAMRLELYQRRQPIRGHEGEEGEERPERLARLVLKDLTEPQDGKEEEEHVVDAMLTMSSDGSLHVSCSQKKSGQTEEVTIAARTTTTRT